MKTLKFNIFSAADLSRLRHELIKGVGGEPTSALIHRQKKFLESVACKSATALLSQLPEGRGDTELTLPVFNRKITEAELFNPPIDTEKLIFSTLSELEPRYACSPAFWASLHLQLISRDIVSPSYFAMGKVTMSGRARIQKSLQCDDKKMIDDCVRTFFRRFCGLPEVRGTSSVFLDCRTARAWWRGFLVSEVRQYIDAEEDKLWRKLRHTEFWTHLMMYGVRKLTVISDRKIRVATIVRFAEMHPELKSRQDIQQFLGKIGARSTYQVMGALTVDENLKIIKSLEE